MCNLFRQTGVSLIRSWPPGGSGCAFSPNTAHRFPGTPRHPRMAGDRRQLLRSTAGAFRIHTTATGRMTLPVCAPLLRRRLSDHSGAAVDRYRLERLARTSDPTSGRQETRYVFGSVAAHRLLDRRGGRPGYRSVRIFSRQSEKKPPLLQSGSFHAFDLLQSDASHARPFRSEKATSRKPGAYAENSSKNLQIMVDPNKNNPPALPLCSPSLVNVWIAV